jgi:hypothetical protein
MEHLVLPMVLLVLLILDPVVEEVVATTVAA